MKLRRAFNVFLCAAVPVAVSVACGSSSRNQFEGEQPDSGDLLQDGGGGFETGPASPCAAAAQAKAYVGCDYWPTVTGNLVQDVFDFAVAVANVGTTDANVTVTGPEGLKKTVKVKAGALEKVYLPWSSVLKGFGAGLTRSVYDAKGAFHLVSDSPVVVYQFNPLEFRAAGGEPGKDWSGCLKQPLQTECYSYSNDASLLLPTTAMTGNYRIMGATGFSRHPVNPNTGEVDKTQPLQNLAPTYFAVTATQDGTTVTVKLGPKGKVVGDGRIKSAEGGDTITFQMDAGDVAEVVSPSGNEWDFSGSLLQADKAVQVITGVPCADFPLDTQACDHVEETLFPAETLGKHYVVMRPTGPKSNNVGHIVRIYGNQDGTALSYKPSKPTGCPDSVSAGDVVDCGEVTTDFEIEGTKEFGVGTFQLGGEKADPDWDPFSLEQPQGDPSQSFAVGVEQFRDRYVFLAPTDYKTSFLDLIAEEGTTLKLDGIDKSNELAVLAGTGYFRARIRLSNGNDGVHVLEASKPVGIQVIGYGDNTSYQYPGGLNLTLIAPPPVK